MSDDVLNLEIGRDEALVLFELIADYNMEPELKLTEHAERISMNLLVGALEKTLVEPFRPDYLELVRTARARLVEQYGSQE
jgi:hypothetical protein